MNGIVKVLLQLQAPCLQLQENHNRCSEDAVLLDDWHGAA